MPKEERHQTVVGWRWSQRWFDDPPVGTVNLDGGRNPEIYIGNGAWWPLDVH